MNTKKNKDNKYIKKKWDNSFDKKWYNKYNKYKEKKSDKNIFERCYKNIFDVCCINTFDYCDENKIIFIIMVLFIFLLILYLIFASNDCDNNADIINENINNKVSGILIDYKNNLNFIIEQIIKSNNPKLSTSNIKLMNNISKITSNIINEEIIDCEFGKIINGFYLGIINYYCKKNKLKKEIFSLINILNFMKVSDDKLINNEYTTNNNSIDVIYNLTNIIISINKYLEKI